MLPRPPLVAGSLLHGRRDGSQTRQRGSTSLGLFLVSKPHATCHGPRTTNHLNPESSWNPMTAQHQQSLPSSEQRGKNEGGKGSSGESNISEDIPRKFRAVSCECCIFRVHVDVMVVGPRLSAARYLLCDPSLLSRKGRLIPSRQIGNEDNSDAQRKRSCQLVDSSLSLFRARE